MAGDSFSFFALGDFGVNVHHFIPSMSRHFLQSALAMKLLAQSPEIDLRFVTLLGDNAYLGFGVLYFNTFFLVLGSYYSY